MGRVFRDSMHNAQSLVQLLCINTLHQRFYPLFKKCSIRSCKDQAFCVR